VEVGRGGGSAERQDGKRKKEGEGRRQRVRKGEEGTREGKEGSGGKTKKGEKGNDWGILCWNVAGMNNKDKEFWKELGK